MHYTYDLYIDRFTRKHPKSAIREIASRHSSIEFDHISCLFRPSDDESLMRSLYLEVISRGFKCSFGVIIHYEIADALIGSLGMLEATSGNQWGTLPKDAFDFTAACTHCGVGATQVKPHTLNARCIRYKGDFLSGQRGTSHVLIRTEIANEIIQATGQPECMRHPLNTEGKAVKEWMEPVPTAVLPPLSRRSLGVCFGSTTANVLAGDPPEMIPPCPMCGRIVWDRNYEQPLRLCYSKAAIKAAQKHAVVSMYEPRYCFPDFDPVKQVYTNKYLAGIPDLLFNRTALDVLANYIRPDYTESNIRFLSCIVPVFSE